MLKWLVLFCATITACHSAEPDYEPQNGDIVFHTSRSSQSVAIQRATHSPYSHMGIVYIDGGEPMVYEAVQPVKFTPLSTWIRRGKDGRFVAKRLREISSVLNAEALRRMKEEGKRFQGRPYDLGFRWSDDELYCSELVWKIYQRALGIELGRLQPLSDFDLSDPAVQAKMKERWGGLPSSAALFISPAAMFASERLETVFQNYAP